MHPAPKDQPRDGNGMTCDAQQLADIAHLVRTLKPTFATRDPEIVGAVLGELVAIFIAGHHPSMRSEAKRCLLEHIDNMVPVVAKELIEQGVVPEHWKKGFDA